jgi:hypothetical protein
MKNVNSAPSKVFEVTVTNIVYVVAESKDKANSLVMDNSSAAWMQSKAHAITEVDEITKISSVEKGREFDRPLGSEKKLLKELLSS